MLNEAMDIIEEARGSTFTVREEVENGRLKSLIASIQV